MMRTTIERLVILLCVAAGCGGGGGGGGGGGDDDGGADGAIKGCGDGIVQAGEECDEGAGNSDTAADACRTACEDASCGDGVMDDGEICDDGDDNSDTAADACREDCDSARCGDGTVDSGEACDDEDADDQDECRNDCTSPVLWAQLYDGGGGGAEATDVAIDADGNVIVVGRLLAASFDGWVRKFDADGDLLWTQTYDGPAGGGEGFRGVAVDAGGNVLVAGYETTAAGDIDVWVRKYDPGGTPIWTRTYDGPDAGNDLAVRIAVDAAGNAFVVGSVTAADGFFDVWLRKYDSAGGVSWTKQLDGGGGDDDDGLGVAVDAGGNVLMSGQAIDALGVSVTWIHKYDTDGAPIWTQSRAPVAASYLAYGLAADSASNVLIAGLEINSGGTLDAWVEMADPDGNTQWSRTHDGPAADIDWAYDVAVDATDNTLIAGLVTATGGDFDALIQGYDPSGSVLWTRTYDADGGDEFGNGIAADADGNVVVVGGAFDTAGIPDAFIRKYEP